MTNQRAIRRKRMAYWRLVAGVIDHIRREEGLEQREYCQDEWVHRALCALGNARMELHGMRGPDPICPIHHEAMDVMRSRHGLSWRCVATDPQGRRCAYQPKRK